MTGRLAIKPELSKVGGGEIAWKRPSEGIADTARAEKALNGREAALGRLVEGEELPTGVGMGGENPQELKTLRMNERESVATTRISSDDIELVIDQNTGKLKADGGEPNHIGEYNNVDKQDLLKSLLRTKPKYAHDPEWWLEQGGRISIQKDGTWVYHDWEDHYVSYRNGYPDFKSADMVIQEVKLDEIVSYYKDFRKADKVAKDHGRPRKDTSTWHHIPYI